MGGLTTLASTAVQALGTVGTVMNAVDSFQDKSGQRDYKETKAMYDLQSRQAQERAALEKEQMRVTAENADAERRAALRRAVARQRAQYGASGISSGDGSGQAVLLGLFEESDEERARRESLDQLKSAALDQNIAQSRGINRLQLAQLQERSRIKTLGALASSGTSLTRSRDY